MKAVAEAISPRLADAAVTAYVDDKMVDLTYPLTQDAKVRIVTSKNPEALEVYRHSTAHLLAAAVTALFPKVQCGIGPPIEDGFYYDFIVERPFVPEDLEAIEKKMRGLAQGDFIYERQMWPRQEAIDFFTKRGEPLKVQLIEEKTAGQPEVSVYPTRHSSVGNNRARWLPNAMPARSRRSKAPAFLIHGSMTSPRGSSIAPARQPAGSAPLAM